MGVLIDWRYVAANKPYALRWTEETGRQVGILTYLLNAGMCDEEVVALRNITTKARVVSEYLEESEAHGLVSASN